MSCGFYFYSPNTFSLKPKPYFPPPPLYSSPLSAEKAVNMHAKATGGHGIGSPCKPPSQVQRVRSAIRDDGAAGTGAKSDLGEHCSTRFGARTRMFEAGFGRSHGWRRPKCRLRRSVRPVGRDEGTREAGGLPGEKTFGVICQRERSFKSHSPQPEGRAKSLRGPCPRVLHGEAMPLRHGTTFSRGMTLAPSP